LTEKALPTYVKEILRDIADKLLCIDSSSKSIISKLIIYCSVMLINKSLIPMAILILIVALIITPGTVFSNTYVGFYNIINWPVLSVTLINGTSKSNGIIIVISPGELSNQPYEIFSGIGLISDNYLLVDGIIYTNGTISIAELTPINASISSGNVGNEVTATPGVNITIYGTSDYVVIGQRTYHVGQMTERSSIMSNNVSGNFIMSNGNINNAQSTVMHSVNKKGESSNIIMHIIVNSSLLTTVLMITLLISLPFLRIQIRDNKDCINDAFIKFVKKLGVRDPSLTHRDLSKYLLRNNYQLNDTVNRVINYYEMAIYGNRPIKCEEFKRLVKEVLNAGIYRRH